MAGGQCPRETLRTGRLVTVLGVLLQFFDNLYSLDLQRFLGSVHHHEMNVLVPIFG